MLSADLSVFNAILPTLNFRFQAIILFCVQASPLLLTPIVVLNIDRLKKYFRRASPKIAAPENVSKEVKRKVHALLEVKKLSTCRTLTDYAALLSSLFVVFLWIKATSVGIATVPAFDLCLLPVTLVWLVYAAVFQGDLLPHTGRTVTCVAFSYNMLLVYNQVLILLLNVTDRDSLLLVCRLFAGFIYCDHWKAAATQVIWIMLKSATPPHVSDPQHDEIHEFWDVFLWGVFRQFVCIAPMWLLWFAVEYFVKQFTELMVQKADMNASLDAARSVLASQCDAEAYLGSDLRFQNPSPKMAHFFGMKNEDLEKKAIVDLLNDADSERFKKLVASSVKQMQQRSGGSHQTAASLTLTFKHASGRGIETQIYLGSVPGSLGDEEPCHIIAFNEVRDSIDVAPEVAVEAEVNSEPKIEKSSLIESTQEPSDIKDGMPPLNANNLAFHAWSHSKSSSQPSIETVLVVFEPRTLEVKEISMKLPTSSTSKHRRKTALSLRECILPAAWDELQAWLDAKSSKEVDTGPPVIPFTFPKFIRSVLAARNPQVSKISSKCGGNDKIMLTLSDIRLRHFQLPRSMAAPTMGRGTASQVSRCSLDDL